MPNMLVLINRLDIEYHLSEIKKIATAHGIVKMYLAKVSPDFGPRVRSILAPHKLDMVIQMSDAATSKYLSPIVDDLRVDGINCDITSISIPAKKLDEFIDKNNIDLVLTSDGRSGLCRWPRGGLVKRQALLYEHTFAEEKVGLTRGDRTKAGIRKMLVLLSRLDIEERLPELKDIIRTQGVKKVYLAGVSLASSPGSQRIAAVQELPPVERMVVYLARVSHAFGSRVRSRVSAQKLDMAARMGNAAANKYLLKLANALAADGIETITIGVNIPADKIDEHIERNDIDVIVTGDGRAGLCSWPSPGLTGRNLRAVLEEVRAEEPVSFKRLEVKARFRLRTIAGIALQFSVLFLFWFLLSGSHRLEHIIFGVASAALVTYFTNDLVFPPSNAGKREKILPAISQVWGFFTYVPTLFARIMMANLQVAYLVLHPKMPINPAFIQFRTRMRRSAAQVLLANSITLTPGTVTVDLKNGEYTVHALVPSSAHGLATGQMQNEVGAIFGEIREKPDIAWCHSMNEVEK